MDVYCESSVYSDALTSAKSSCVSVSVSVSWVRTYGLSPICGLTCVFLAESNGDGSTTSHGQASTCEAHCRAPQFPHDHQLFPSSCLFSFSSIFDERYSLTRGSGSGSRRPQTPLLNQGVELVKEGRETGYRMPGRPR